MNDNLDTLLRDLHYIDSGWHRHENPVTGAVALFPSVEVHPSGSKEARAVEADWEARASAMHAAQTPVTLAEKPAENTLAERVVRAD